MSEPPVIPSSSPLFEAVNVSTSFTSPHNKTHKTQIIKDISFSLERGKALALVGESGAGKSVLAMSLLNILPYWTGPKVSGALWLDGDNILDASKQKWLKLRRHRLGYIPQDAMHSLAPYLKVATQIKEVLPSLSDPSKSLDDELLSRVGLNSLDYMLGLYPFELSGGMRQQVLTLMALARGPELLVADEPTSSIDVTLQARLLETLSWAKKARNIGLLFITHDLRSATRIADQIAVIHSGRLVEQSSTDELLQTPRHPYTQLLLRSANGWKTSAESDRLLYSKQPRKENGGCEFANQCNLANNRCRTEVPSIQNVSQGHWVRCFFPRTELPAQPEPIHLKPPPSYNATNDHCEQNPVLEICSLTIDVEKQRGLLLSNAQQRRVVHNLSLSLARGECLGLVGESGSGKTISCLAVVGLVQPTEGEVFFNGNHVSNILTADERRIRRRLQMIFQSPASSLNPLMTVGQILAEPQQIHFKRSARQIEKNSLSLLQSIGLSPNVLGRTPGQLSQGQRQRVAIARSLTFEPQVLIADEPLSSQDMVSQQTILSVLAKWQREQRGGMIFISHDLGTVQFLADRVAVLCQGTLVEIASTENVFSRPLHPYTQCLINAIPSLKNEPVLPSADPSFVKTVDNERTSPGCPYAFRCCNAKSICRQGPLPTLKEISPNHRVACHMVHV